MSFNDDLFVTNNIHMNNCNIIYTHMFYIYIYIYLCHVIMNVIFLMLKENKIGTDGSAWMCLLGTLAETERGRATRQRAVNYFWGLQQHWELSTRPFNILFCMFYTISILEIIIYSCISHVSRRGD
jgi:hypothetical protein